MASFENLHTVWIGTGNRDSRCTGYHVRAPTLVPVGCGGMIEKAFNLSLVGQGVHGGQCHSCDWQAKKKRAQKCPLSSVHSPGRQGTSCSPCALHSRKEEAAGKVLLTVGEGVFASLEVLMCESKM